MNRFWLECLLGEAITLQRGFDLPERDRIQGSVPIVSSSGVTGFHDTVKVKAPGVVTGRYGTLGEIHFVTDDFWPLNTTLYVKDFKGNHPRYISYFLRTLNFASQNSAGAVPGVNRNHLHQIKVAIPPLEIQRKIASILSAYDDLIENNTRRIAILESLAKAIYREWFVEFRFPGHENVKLVDSPLGKIPEGWIVQPLSALCFRITDGSHRSPKSVESNGLPMASMKDMDDWGLDLSECRFISKADFDDLVRSDSKPKVGDVLVAKDGASYLKYIFVVEKEIDVVLLSSIAILRPNGQLLPHLMTFILRDPRIKGRLANYVTGAAIPRVILKDFARFEVVVPNKSTQAQWWNHTAEMIGLIHRLRAKNKILRESRDLLLPKLISGELNVETVDIHAFGDDSFGTDARKQAIPDSSKMTVQVPITRPLGTPFKDDAAVVCVLLDELIKLDRPTKEFDIQKHTFALKYRPKLPINSEFAVQTAGPWSQELRRKAFYAGQGAGWFQFDETTKTLSLGSKFEEGLTHAKRVLGQRIREIQEMVADLSKFGSSGLERWMTIFKIVIDLRDADKTVSRQAIQTGIDNWKGKRAKPHFSIPHVNSAIDGMVKHGWFKLDS